MKIVHRIEYTVLLELLFVALLAAAAAAAAAVVVVAVAATVAAVVAAVVEAQTVLSVFVFPFVSIFSVSPLELYVAVLPGLYVDLPEA